MTGRGVDWGLVLAPRLLHAEFGVRRMTGDNNREMSTKYCTVLYDAVKISARKSAV